MVRTTKRAKFGEFMQFIEQVVYLFCSFADFGLRPVSIEPGSKVLGAETYMFATHNGGCHQQLSYHLGVC